MKSEKLSLIVKNIEMNKSITIEDLEILKNFNANDLEELLSLDHEEKKYIIKAYFTVIDYSTLNKVYNKKPTIVSNILAESWVFEVLNSKIEDIISAYLPISLFSTNLIDIIRTGISNNYKEYIIEFENKNISLLKTLINEEDYILSKIYLLSNKYSNKEFLFNLENSGDKESYLIANKVLNVILSFKLIYEIYETEDIKLKENLKFNLEKNKNADYFNLVKKIIPNYMQFIIKELEDKSINMMTVLNKESEVEPISEIITEKKEPKLISKFKSILNNENDNKKEKFKLSLDKKRGNLKILLISSILIIISFFSIMKIVKIEIEKSNKIINKEVIKDSDIEVEVILNEKN